MAQHLLAVSILVAVLLVPSASSQAAASTNRCVDSAAGGFTEISASADVFLDQKVIDSQGRLLVMEMTSIEGGFTDRLLRFNPDGTPDLSFGTDGAASLSGVSRSFRMRNVTVDGEGRIWTLRATFANQFEVRRFLDSGVLDESFERYLYDENGVLDAVADIEMSANGLDLLIAYGRQVGDADGGAIQLVTIRPDTIYHGRVGSSYLPGAIPTVLDVNPDGWVAGRLDTTAAEPVGTAFGWRWEVGFGDNVPYQTETPGLLSSIETLPDGRVIGVGAAFVDGQSDALVVRLDPNVDRGGDTQALGFGERIVDLGNEADAIGRVLPDGTVIALTGEDVTNVGVGFGTIALDGDVELGPVTPLGVPSVVPLEARIRPNGGIDLASFADNSGAWRATFTAPTPSLDENSLDGQIQRLYAAYFGRPADDAGLNFWRNQRATGRSIESVSDAFSASPEFVDTYGALSESEFVRLVYRNVLGREGDAAGISFWIDQVEAGDVTRGRTMVAFSDSPENIERTATAGLYGPNAGSLLRLYRAYFDRAPDAGGACFWIASFDGGMSLATASESFATSAEFLDTYGSLSDQAFVELVYRNVFGREGDPAGIDFWTTELFDGRRTRGDVLVGFSESPEYVEATRTLPRD